MINEVKDMKLAQALNERADLQARMTELENRLLANARTQEGIEPAEDPEKLFAEYEGCTAQLEELIARINRTNNTTVIEGKTLTELLAKRDCLKMRVMTYRNFLNEASMTAQRARHSEIKILSTVSVSDYRKILDDYSKELRELDGVIQMANWTTELV